MDQTRVFKRYEYNELLGGSDSVWTFDFAGAGYYEDGYVARPSPRRTAPKQPAPSRRREHAEPKSRVGAHSAVRSAEKLSPALILGFLLSAAMLVLVLMAQVRMTALSDSAAGLENEIFALRSEQNRLLAQYETSFPLAEVERYAVEELGMQKPRPEQIVWLSSLGTDDRAEILVPQEESVFSLGLQSFSDSLRAYFGSGR